MYSLSDLIGSPFKFGGTGPEYDCYRLAQEVYRRIGRKLPDMFYAEQPEQINGLMEEGKQQFIRIEQPEVWALVTFRMKGPLTTHVGVVMPGKVQFLHILPKSFACIEWLNSPIWRHRITGYFICP